MSARPARASWSALLSLVVVGAAAPGPRAQLANDECDGALPIDVGIVSGDTDGATDSPVTGSCASFGGFTGSDVWFSYVASQAGVLSLSLVNGGGFADFDTVLAGFSGPCGALVEEACNDDAGSLQSKLSLFVTTGQEYHIELGGWSGGTGHFELAVTFQPQVAPDNDKCSTALPVADGLYSGMTYFATTAATTPSCAAFGAPVTNDVWFLYTAPTDGFLRASLANAGGFADFDTVMSAFTGPCGSGLVEVACNDDAPGTLASELVFPVVAGTSYRIEIGGWNGAVGEFTLSLGYVTLPANDECAGALPVGPGLVSGSTSLATTSPVTADCGFQGGPVGSDLWFDFTAPDDGVLRASTAPDGGGFADFDTVIAAFAGDCDGLAELACNDDAGPLTLLSEISFPVSKDETYHLVVGGFAESSGDFGLNLALQVQGPTPDVVISHAKISDTEGGFLGDLSHGLGSFGTGVAALGDVDGDGVGDLAVGSPFEDLQTPDAGALWLLFLNAGGSVKSHVRLSAGAGGLGFPTGQTQFGIGVAPLGDLDADGVPDVAVGADLDDDGGEDHGAVWVLFLESDGSVKASTKISDTQGGFGGVLPTANGFGHSLSRLGDLDGDGTTEIAVGAPNYPDGGNGRGAAWVLFLNPDGTAKDWQRISQTIGGFAGVLHNQDHFGTGVAGLGDIDLDGVPDLAVGAPGDNTGAADNGAVWVLRLMPDGKVAHTSKLAADTNGFDGELFGGVLFGTGLAALADADGDGRSELAVGAVSDPDGGPFHGAVWLIFLDAQGGARRASKISSTHGGFGGVLGDGAFFGEALADMGDLDGDGLGDLAVGNRFDDDGANDRGAVWILFLDAANAWIDLGQGLAGASGEPRLEGHGALKGDTEISLTVTRAAPNAVSAGFMGAALASLPFHGGVLVPMPEVVAWPVITDGAGFLELKGRWPLGLPSGVPYWFQVWLFDPTGPEGFTATNALTIETF